MVIFFRLYFQHCARFSVQQRLDSHPNLTKEKKFRRLTFLIVSYLHDFDFPSVFPLIITSFNYDIFTHGSTSIDSKTKQHNERMQKPINIHTHMSNMNKNQTQYSMLTKKT